MPPRAPKSPPPPKPWVRAAAGRHRSSDERFTLESDGGGRWFVTDDRELDELGLARTTGPFATLDAAKAAADAIRDRKPEASPFAARLAEVAARPRATRATRATQPVGSVGFDHRDQATQPATEGRVPPPDPAPSPRTWLDDLEAQDGDEARRARRLVDALARDGIRDGEALVRRDLLGGDPAIATRLLARDLLAALATLRDPSTLQVLEAVMDVLASSPKHGVLPGWELTERDGPSDGPRRLRPTGADLEAAARDGNAPRRTP